MKSSCLQCAKCKKNILIVSECSCKKQFCLACRHPEDHNCDFDHKQKAIEQLVKQNPMIIGEKISKI
jgi:predicted nucleic acid binding AN1-type Zn finger protein